MAASVNQNITGNAYIDGLIGGTKWDGAFTFSFPQLASQYEAGNPETDPGSGFAPVTSQQREAVRAILMGTTFGGTTNVMLATSVNSFIAVAVSESGGPGNGLSGSGDIRVAESNNANPTAYAYYPNNAANGNGGDVWLGTALVGTVNDYRNPVMGNYAYHTHIHELGHAMGLKHSHEADGPGNIAVPADKDSAEWTVMSYRSYSGGSFSGGYTYGAWDAPQTFMIYDIQALQTLYGAYYGAGSNNTNTIYTWNAATGATLINGVSQGTPGGNKVFMTVWDGGGVDTYDMSNFGGGVSINLAPGATSITSEAQRADLGDGHTAQGNVYNSLLFNGNLASIIENATGGAGSDIIVGNQVANVLIGGAGGDFMIGGAGGDTIDGGSGFDIVSWLDEVSGVSVNITNQLLNGVAAAGDIVSGFEAYYLTNSGDSFTNNTSGGYIYGFGGGDILTGGAGSEFIDGGASGDAINAGGGFDYVSYSNAATGVTLNMITPASNTGEAAGDNITNAEAFYLSSFGDTFIGQTGQNIVFGGGGGDNLFGGVNSSDWLFGEAGNDFLSGGAFDDLLSGGAGADTIAFTSWVGNGFDSIFDFVSGTDKIQLGASGFGLLTGQAFTAGFNFFSAVSPVATQHIGTLLYATGFGILYYDPDGTGAIGAIPLAQFAGAPALVPTDFFVV